MRTASPQAMAIVKSTAPMLEKHDVETTKMGPGLSEQDLAKLIPEFYARVRPDPILGPIFDGAIDDCGEHLEKLQAFWSSIMLTGGRHKGQPMVTHLRHQGAMTAANFDRWLALWKKRPQISSIRKLQPRFRRRRRGSLKACSLASSSSATDW